MAAVIKQEKWKALKRPLATNGRPLVWAHCPGCDQLYKLDHEIADDGILTPSLDCPTCPFHETGVQLEGWPGEAALNG